MEITNREPRGPHWSRTEYDDGVTIETRHTDDWSDLGDGVWVVLATVTRRVEVNNANLEDALREACRELGVTEERPFQGPQS